MSLIVKICLFEVLLSLVHSNVETYKEKAFQEIKVNFNDPKKSKNTEQTQQQEKETTNQVQPSDLTLLQGPYFEQEFENVILEYDPFSNEALEYNYTSPTPALRTKYDQPKLLILATPNIGCRASKCLQLINTNSDVAPFFNVSLKFTKQSFRNKDKIRITVQLYNGTFNTKFQEYGFSIQILFIRKVPPYFVILTAPYLATPPEIIILEYDFKLNFAKFKRRTYPLPEIITNDDQEVIIKHVYFEPADKYQFISISNNTQNYSMQFEPNKVTQRALRHSPIELEIVLVDSDNMVTRVPMYVIVKQKDTFKVSLKPKNKKEDKDTGNDKADEGNKQENQFSETKVKNSPDKIQTVISDVSSFGKIKCKFYKSVKIMSKDNLSIKSGRLLQEIQQIDNETIGVEVVSDQLNPDEPPPPPLVNQTIIEFNNKTNELIIQAFFNNPYDISSSYSQDQVFVRFANPNIFTTDKGQGLGQLALNSFIKKQMPQSSVSKQFLVALTVIGKVLAYSIVILFIQNLVSPGDRNRLTESVMPLQIVMLHMMINYPIPANVMKFGQKIKQIASFDLIPLLTNAAPEELDPQEIIIRADLLPHHQDLGFKHHKIVKNLGLMFYLVVILLVGLLVLFAQAIYNYFAKKPRYITKTHTIYRGFSKLILAGFMPISIAVYLHYSVKYADFNAMKVKFFAFTDSDNLFNAISTDEFAAAIFLILGLVYLPLSLLISFAVSQSIFNISPIFSQIFGFFCFNVKRDSRKKKLYMVFFVLRRLFLILIAFSLYSNALAQLILNTFMTLAYMMYIGMVKPLMFRSLNNRELTNEFIILLITDLLFIFGNLQNDTKAQYKSGWVLICLVMFLIVINYQLMAREIVWRFKILGVKNYRVAYLKVTGKRLGPPSRQSQSKILESATLRQDKIHNLSSNLSTIRESTDTESDSSEIVDTGDDELDELLRQARQQLSEQNKINLKKLGVRDKKNFIIKELRKLLEKRMKIIDDTDNVNDKLSDQEHEVLLSQAKALLDDQSIFDQRKREIALQQEKLLKKLTRRKQRSRGNQEIGDNEADIQGLIDLEKFEGGNQEMGDNEADIQGLIDLEKLEEDAKDFIGNGPSDRFGNLDALDDQSEIEQMLEDARDLLANQQMYDQKLNQNNQLLLGLLEKLGIFIGQTPGGDEDDDELEELLTQAREMFNEEGLINKDLLFIKIQSQNILDRIKKRNRLLQGKAEESDDDNQKKLENNVDEFIAKNKKITKYQADLFIEQKGMLIQDKILNSKLKDITRRNQESNQNPLQFIQKSLPRSDSKNLDGSLSQVLNKAGGLQDEQLDLNQKQSGIGKTQEKLLEKLKQKKLKFIQEIAANPDQDNLEREAAFLHDIEELIKEAKNLMNNQTLANRSQQEIEQKQRELMEKLQRRKSCCKKTEFSNELDKLNDDSLDEFNQLLGQAQDLLNEKMTISLELEEKDNENIACVNKMNERRMKFQERLSQPLEIDEYLDEAKRVIDDQQMQAQQKIEIGQQQNDLMDKIAKRRGRKAVKEKSPEEKAKENQERKIELLDPKLQTKKRKAVDCEDLDEMIQRAKDIINDQNLISSLQIDISKQQSSLNDIMAARRRLQDKKEMNEMLAKTQKLTQDQTVLNHKLKDIEEEQQQIIINISNENKKHSGGIESEIDVMLQQAKTLGEEQTKLTDIKISSDSKLMLRIIDQKTSQIQIAMSNNKDKIKKQLSRFINFQMNKQDIGEMLIKAREMISNQSLFEKRSQEIEMQQIEFQKRKDKRNKNKIKAIKPISELENIIILSKPEDIESQGGKDSQLDSDQLKLDKEKSYMLQYALVQKLNKMVLDQQSTEFEKQQKQKLSGQDKIKLMKQKGGKLSKFIK